MTQSLHRAFFLHSHGQAKQQRKGEYVLLGCGHQKEPIALPCMGKYVFALRAKKKKVSNTNEQPTPNPTFLKCEL